MRLIIGGHNRTLEVIGCRLRSILGLFSSFRAICRTDGMDGIGWLSQVVGSLRAPAVIIKIRNRSTIYLPPCSLGLLDDVKKSLQFPHLRLKVEATVGHLSLAKLLSSFISCPLLTNCKETHRLNPHPRVSQVARLKLMRSTSSHSSFWRIKRICRGSKLL